MKHSNFLSDTYLDVLFRNKNKAYGAYQIRANYRSTAARAVLIFFGCVGILCGGVYLYRNINTTPIILDSGSAQASYDTTVVDLVQVHKDVPKELPVDIPSKALGTTTESIKTVANETPKITPNNLVAATDLVVAPTDSNASISNVNNTDGISGSNLVKGFSDGVVGGTSLDSNALAVVPPDVPVANFVYDKVDAKASAKYDINAFVSKRLRYPEMAKVNGIEGRVMVTFIVEKDGSISNVSFKGANIGGGCVEEAINVIKALPKWKPATVKGNFVRSYFQYPITFRLDV